MDDLRVKYRTDERNGRVVATATIWMDGKQLREIATFDLELAESPGDPVYQGWVDAVSDAFAAWMSRKTGAPRVPMKRRKPSYRGERS